MGGTGTDDGYSISVDGLGNALVGGVTNSSDLPARANGYKGGNLDAFVARVSRLGSLDWSMYLGGSGDDAAYGIAAGREGAVWVTGWTTSTNFTGAGNSNNGGMDAFVAKFNGPGENILISGTTNYDANAEALAAVMNEWSSDKSFEDRGNSLDSGITDTTAGLIQLNRKDKSNRKGTLLDAARDTLFAGPASDWFFDFAKDTVRDRDLAVDR